MNPKKNKSIFYSIARPIKHYIETLLKIKIYKTLPRGVDVLSDINLLLPHFKAQIIFDVGANVGQSALRYLKNFEQARVYSFEPVEESFEVLKANISDSRLIPHQIAMSDQIGVTHIVTRGTSDMYHIPKSQTYQNEQFGIEIQTNTIDNFCITHAISDISYLKIDTEGHDLNVLYGAKKMLEQEHVQLVEVEVGMNITNKWHVPFHDIEEFMTATGYLPFGIYEQFNEWPTKRPELRRANVVFISKKCSDENSTFTRHQD